MGIIAPRDFVDVILVKRYEDGSVSSNGVFVPVETNKVLGYVLVSSRTSSRTPPGFWSVRPPDWIEVQLLFKDLAQNQTTQAPPPET